jgi:hypothetical protein
MSDIFIVRFRLLCSVIKQALGVVLLVMALVAQAAADKATVDVSTFTAPAGWKQATQKLGVEYSAANKQAAASIFVMQSIAGASDPRANFDKAWANFVTATLPDAPAPTMTKTTLLDGWQLVRGTTTYKFQDRPGKTTIVTATRDSTLVVVLVTTVGTAMYDKAIDEFFASLHFAAPAGAAATPSTATAPSASAPAPAPQQTLTGAWGFSTGGKMGSGQFAAWLSDRREYAFDGNGNYTFLRRHNVDQEPDTSIIRERGTYTLKGDVLALTPTKSEREIWNKVKSGPNAGAYEKLVRREKVALEKATYRVEYTVYLQTQVPNLMLTPSAATQRDGNFNATTQYRLFRPDASYYTAIPPTP